MSGLSDAVNRLTARTLNTHNSDQMASDLRLVLSRLEALERECKAWRALEEVERTPSGPHVYQRVEHEEKCNEARAELTYARAATDATEGK